MSKTYIIKIGTFIPVDKDLSAMGLLTGEPKNFANALLKLGVTSNIIFASNANVIDGNYEYRDISENSEDGPLNFCYDAKSDDVVIFWQGAYKYMEDKPVMLNTYLSLQSAQQSGITKQFFVLTDTRLPLLDLEAYLQATVYKSAEPYIDIDYSKVTMLTQASKATELRDALYNDTLNTGIPEYVGYYVKNFKAVQHLELYALPLISHDMSMYAVNVDIHSHDLIFTTQSFDYMQQYRFSRLYKLLLDVDTRNESVVTKYDIAIYGKHEVAGTTKLLEFINMFKYSNNNTDKFVVLPKLIGPIQFDKLKHMITAAKTQLCVSEQDYIKYDLLPNRIFESIACSTLPLIDIDIIESTDCAELIEFTNNISFSVVHDVNDIHTMLYNKLYNDEHAKYAMGILCGTVLCKFKNSLNTLYADN